MTLTRAQLTLVALAVMLLLAVTFAVGRGCGSTPGGVEPVHMGIDAGPGEAVIAARLDAAVQAGEAHMQQIEDKFEDDLAAFDQRQREEYERLRGGDDLEAAARMLSDWNRSRRDAGA